MRQLIWITLLMAALVFAACGGRDEEPAPAAEEPAAAATEAPAEEEKAE